MSEESPCTVCGSYEKSVRDLRVCPFCEKKKHTKRMRPSTRKFVVIDTTSNGFNVYKQRNNDIGGYDYWNEGGGIDFRFLTSGTFTLEELEIVVADMKQEKHCQEMQKMRKEINNELKSRGFK